MWQATFRCTDCGEPHVFCCGDENKPRLFFYDCPGTKKKVEVRFHDPSRVIDDWKPVDRPAPEAISVEGTSSRGAFEG